MAISSITSLIKTFLISLHRLPWAKSFDWDYWKSAAQQLPDNHPSVAKDYTELSLQSSPELDSQTTTKELILSHKMLLDRLIYTLRAGNYAIRTEQTYADWVRRFLTFNNWGQSKVKMITIKRRKIK